MLSAESARAISYSEGCVFQYVQDVETKIRYAAGHGETSLFYMIHDAKVAQARRFYHVLCGAGYEVEWKWMNGYATYNISWT